MPACWPQSRFSERFCVPKLAAEWGQEHDVWAGKDAVIKALMANGRRMLTGAKIFRPTFSLAGIK
jgi:hypothetical protein